MSPFNVIATEINEYWHGRDEELESKKHANMQFVKFEMGSAHADPFAKSLVRFNLTMQ